VNEVAGEVGSMLKVDVPVSDIFSTPYTGNGCLGEKEIVALGGIKKAEVVDEDVAVQSMVYSGEPK